MTRRTIGITMLTAGIVLATGAGFAMTARGRMGGPGAGGSRLLGRVVNDPELQKRLGLSEDQVAKLRTIRDEGQKQMIRLRADVQESKLDLRSALERDDATRADIEARAKAVTKAVSAMHDEALQTMLDARDVLSAEQRSALRTEIRSRVREMGKGRSDWRRGHGRGSEGGNDQEPSGGPDADTPGEASPDGVGDPDLVDD